MFMDLGFGVSIIQYFPNLNVQYIMKEFFIKADETGKSCSMHNKHEKCTWETLAYMEI
jgi:hypothetical protein